VKMPRKKDPNFGLIIAAILILILLFVRLFIPEEQPNPIIKIYDTSPNGALSQLGQ
jgi:hypothetical protein